MPGSQRMDSIDLAYFLYSWRWTFRLIFVAICLAGLPSAFRTKDKWIPFVALGLVLAIAYVFNFRMTAEKMFRQPTHLVFKGVEDNTLPRQRVVIGVQNQGEAKAYPIVLMAYHHQVQDSIGGKAFIITYCNVCRTGRAFEPEVNGKPEQFRLVGMDHFNAMFEDATTKSWWRQTNGEAITGPLKGKQLSEVHTWQMTIDQWFNLFPRGVVMQPDPEFISEYDSLAKFELGLSPGKLTRTDSLSWQDKSWVVGLEMMGESKAYDWQELRKVGVINDVVGGKHIVIALSSDSMSFAAFERPTHINFTIDSTDRLVAGTQRFDFAGNSLYPDSIPGLIPVNAYQEFWHSWLTFHPDTQRYLPAKSE